MLIACARDSRQRAGNLARMRSPPSIRPDTLANVERATWARRLLRVALVACAVLSFVLAAFFVVMSRLPGEIDSCKSVVKGIAFAVGTVVFLYVGLRVFSRIEKALTGPAVGADLPICIAVAGGIVKSRVGVC